MNVKEAVKAAKEHVKSMFDEEGLSNLGLEEVEFRDVEDAWYITVAFSRPWDKMSDVLAMVNKGPSANRIYKVVKVNNLDGGLISVKNRDV